LFRVEHAEHDLEVHGLHARTFDPAATMKDREVRQKLADDIEVNYRDKAKD